MDNGITLTFRTNLFLGTEEMGRKILGVLTETGGIFVPEMFDGGNLTGGKVKFDSTDINLTLKAWTGGRYESGIIAERRHPLKVFFHVSATDFTMFDHVNLSICLDRKGTLDQKRVNWFLGNLGIEKVVEVAKKLYEMVSPNWGYIQNDFSEHIDGQYFDAQGQLQGFRAPKGLARQAIQGLFWANFLGPEYVQVLGEEKLLKAPVYRTEKLSDGGMLLFLSESPFDAFKEEYSARKEKLRSYLGTDAFDGKLLPRFRVGPGRKLRDARPLVETGGIRDDIFWHSSEN